MPIVKEIMTAPAVTCFADTPIQDAARLMINHDCGVLVVIETVGSSRLVGIVTDRDITCRGAAHGKDPRVTPVAEVMTKTVVSIAEESSLADSCNAMRSSLVRRLPVLDKNGECVGVLSQADLIRLQESEILAVLQILSKPAPVSSRAAILSPKSA